MRLLPLVHQILTFLLSDTGDTHERGTCFSRWNYNHAIMRYATCFSLDSIRLKKMQTSCTQIFFSLLVLFPLMMMMMMMNGIPNRALRKTFSEIKPLSSNYEDFFVKAGK